MSHARIFVGKTGEDLAAAELERRGYVILARRERCRSGELDIVARDGPTLVFVEVKTRTGAAFGGPAEAVTAHKRQRIGRLAREWVLRRGLTNQPCRFDVVSVRIERGGNAGLEVFPNAFHA
ncbi:MAG: YraN family protein [Acidobacteriota bacterium]